MWLFDVIFPTRKNFTDSRSFIDDTQMSWDSQEGYHYKLVELVARRCDNEIFNADARMVEHWFKLDAVVVEYMSRKVE